MAEPIPGGGTYALILAGGRSSRMGADKSLLDVGGRSMLRWAVDFWQGAEDILDGVLIAPGAPEHLPELPPGVVPVYDLLPGCGPMAGLHAAFAQTDAEVLYVSAVDMPFLRRDALLPLPRGDAAVYTRDGRAEPLFGVYRRSCLPALENALAAGQRRMTRLLEALDVEYYPLPEEFLPALENLNTPPDLMRARAGEPPAVVFMGWSGSGKTTFVEKLLPELTGRGLRAAVIKHDGHGFQMDKPGKDTWRFAEAGAAAVAISGPGGWAVLSREQIELEDLRRKLPPADLILIEGHKGYACPKVIVHRAATGKPLPPPGEGGVLAFVTDLPLEVPQPVLGLDDIEACADLIVKTFLPEKG